MGISEKKVGCVGCAYWTKVKPADFIPGHCDYSYYRGRTRLSLHKDEYLALQTEEEREEFLKNMVTNCQERETFVERLQTWTPPEIRMHSEKVQETMQHAANLIEKLESAAWDFKRTSDTLSMEVEKYTLLLRQARTNPDHRRGNFPVPPPFKYGDIAWGIGRKGRGNGFYVKSGPVTLMEYDGERFYIYVQDVVLRGAFGEKVFCTKEAALTALRVLKEKEL